MQTTYKSLLLGLGLTFATTLTLTGCFGPEHEIKGQTATEQGPGDGEENPGFEVTDPTVDTDGDGVPDIYDLDDDNDGIPDEVESCRVDTDGDGIPNCRDLDSDNDGISDLFEVWYGQFLSEGMEPTEALAAAKALDTDNDGRLDVNLNDANNDGRADGVDVDGYVKSSSVIPDINEVFPFNQSGNKLTQRIDTDNDGFADAPSPFDTDGDGIPDAYDLDSDNDGVPDVAENGGLGKDLLSIGTDAQGNAIQTEFPDGIRDEINVLDPIQDNDGDGIPNHLDPTSNGDGQGFDIANPDYDVYTSPAYDEDGDGMIDNTIDRDGDGIPDVADGNDNVFGHGFDGPEQVPTPAVKGGADGILSFSRATTSTTTIVNVRYMCQLIEYPDTKLSRTERPTDGISFINRSEPRRQFVGRVSCGAETNDVVFFLGGENKVEDIVEANQNRLYLGRVSAFDLGLRSGTSQEYTDVVITPELLLKDAFPELEGKENTNHPAVVNMKRLLKSLDIGDSSDSSLQYPGNGLVSNNFLTPDDILIADIVHEAVQNNAGFANTTVMNERDTRETFIEEVGAFFADTDVFEAVAGDVITATEVLKSGDQFEFTDADYYTISETDLAGNGQLLPASAVQ